MLTNMTNMTIFCISSVLLIKDVTIDNNWCIWFKTSIRYINFCWLIFSYKMDM